MEQSFSPLKNKICMKDTDYDYFKTGILSQY